MIFKNIEIYNAVELVEAEGGYDMLRMPLETEKQLGESGQQKNRFCNGIELRFVCIDDEIKIKINSVGNEGVFAYIYYGSIPAGWQECRKLITKNGEITVSKPHDMDKLKTISEENKFPFSPEVVRVILPNSQCRIADVSGNCRPPEKDEVPEKRYLAYGSSITHGSLSLIQMNSYANRTAENFDADLINLGYAGSACMEKAVADYIASRSDWDFATLEMGVNVIGMPYDEFESRVENFIKTIASAHPNKWIFCIDVFYLYAEIGSDHKKCVSRFREIVKDIVLRLGFKNTAYFNGLELLSIGSAGISGDFVHPNIRGCECIAENLAEKIRELTNN